jgi:GT2 family glycosyltransferase
MKDFSVIIVSKNRYLKLRRALDSLLERVTPLENLAEIVVIDNASDDDTRLLSSETFVGTQVPVSVQHNEIVRGVAYNRNKGIESTKSEFIIFLDDDAYVNHLDLFQVKDFFTQNPSVGMLAPHLMYPGGKMQESVRSFPSIRAILWRGLQLYRFAKPSWYRKYVDPFPNREASTEPIRIDWAIGACQIIRRSLFEKIGLLDEKYFFGYEDVDMCFRAQRAGCTIMYWPYATIVHEYARTSAKLFSRAMWRHIRSVFRFFLSW